MADKVVYLHGKPREIAQTTRVAFREHRLCEQLLSANKLAIRRKVSASARRLELAYESLSGLHDRLGSITFPAEAKFRSGSRQNDLFQEKLS